MGGDDSTWRFQRARPAAAADPLQALRNAIVAVRDAPHDADARRELRALATEQQSWEQLAVLLADEARAAFAKPELAAVFYEELAELHEILDQQLEAIAAMERVVTLVPDNAEHHDRLAWLYRKAGAWAKAAESFEQVGALARDERARAALRAAAQLYRDNRKLDRAAALYRTIVTRKPGDGAAWRALDEVLQELARWDELAAVRGERAARAESGVERAALLRAQARALEQAGDLATAAERITEARQHAPEDLSGLVDYADVLARAGQGPQAAQLLEERIANALAEGARGDAVAALRLRLASVLEDACGDWPAASAVLEQLLAGAPTYLPALERIAAHAASQPDPIVHGAALQRYAGALPPNAERAAALIEAARRFRAGGDHDAAVHAFEEAHELVPEDVLLLRELDDERTTFAVERAARDAATGDAAGAERRLRALLEREPHHTAGNLALVDLLVASDAAAWLHRTLASAPRSMPTEQLAPLCHRYAEIVGELGDADESHRLLGEAHGLDRKSLPITLALGESCFARRLWRQAALHLGALAEHPDAPRHASEVALGLVHAAQAELRALRPANAPRHYEAAVRIDPACGPAWHALAELAMERGDTLRAADLLEREASATQNPKLWDALGDMALDVLADPVRAERCWSRLVTSDLVPALEKLLALQRKRGATTERGATCERLAELATEPRVAKELLEEAAQAFGAGGEHDRATTLAEQLVARYPHDLDVLACATAIVEPARAAPWLRRAMAVLERRSAEAGAPHPGAEVRRAALWRRLGDAERALGDEAAAQRAYERAIAAAPESDGALAARRGMIELDKGTDSSLFALVEVEQSADDVLAAARARMRAGELDPARATFQLARALGATLAPEDEELLARPGPTLAPDESYSAPLDDTDRRVLVDDGDDGPLADVLDVLAEVMPLICPDARTALVDAKLVDAQRLPATSTAPVAAMYPQISKAFGGPVTLLHTAAHGPDLTLLLASPAVVVIGPALVGGRAVEDEPALRFQLGRIVELARPRRLFAAGQSPDQFARFTAALQCIAGREPPEPDVAVLGERLRGKLPVAQRQKLVERLAGKELDPAAYVAACQRAADRVGLLACHDVEVAIRNASDAVSAASLVKLAASQRYLAVRPKLRRDQVGRSSKDS